MEDISKRIQVLLNMLINLQDGVAFFNERAKILDAHFTEENEEILLSVRDAMIQRFKCCVELIRKVLKEYLEKDNVNISIISLREVIRISVASCLLSENEGDKCIKMLVVRNRIPDMYQRIVADEIAHAIPEHYELMQTIAERIQEKWGK